MECKSCFKKDNPIFKELESVMECKSCCKKDNRKFFVELETVLENIGIQILFWNANLFFENNIMKTLF